MWQCSDYKHPDGYLVPSRKQFEFKESQYLILNGEYFIWSSSPLPHLTTARFIISRTFQTKSQSNSDFQFFFSEMNVLYFYILTAGVLAMSSITVDENSLKAKPDVNCQLIEREDFTKAFTEGSALVELHRILQNEIKVSKVDQLRPSPSLADAIWLLEIWLVESAVELASVWKGNLSSLKVPYMFSWWISISEKSFILHH